MPVPRVACAVLLLLLTTGCGGSDAPSTAAPPVSTSASPSRAASAEPSQAPATSGTEYVDRDGFAITYPKGWDVKPDLAGLQVAGSPSAPLAGDFSDNVGVLLEDTGQTSLSLAGYLDASVANAPRQISGFTLVERDDAAGTLEFTGDVGRPLHFLARVVVKDGKAFTATFTATETTYARGADVARTVLVSLRAT